MTKISAVSWHLRAVTPDYCWVDWSLGYFEWNISISKCWSVPSMGKSITTTNVFVCFLLNFFSRHHRRHFYCWEYSSISNWAECHMIFEPDLLVPNAQTRLVHKCTTMTFLYPFFCSWDTKQKITVHKIRRSVPTIITRRRCTINNNQINDNRASSLAIMKDSLYVSSLR